MKALEWFRVRVAERKMETNEILHLTLKPSSAGRLPANAGIYVCGPPGFIDWVTQSAVAMDIEVARIKREFF
jgi:ferredoxin-NADP reductase